MAGLNELTAREIARREIADEAVARGALHGVPIGVKDVIDTADLSTEMSSPIFKGHRPRADAACVAIERLNAARDERVCVTS